MFMKKLHWKRQEKDIRGFSLVEITVIVAIMIVLLAVLVPSLLRYVEDSRMQKDDSAMDEVCNAFQLALADSNTFDEAVSYAVPNNYVTYTDSSGIYGVKNTDEEFWAPDGSGHAVTVTFNPTNNGTFIIADGRVNDMTTGNGSVATPRIAEGLQQCAFSDMGKQLLYKQVEQSIGISFEETSATYRNSSYTIFITVDIVDNIKRVNVYGEWNGTNLSPDCPASLGSGTESYTPEGVPEMTKPGGTTTPKFDQSDLTGGGGTVGGDIPEPEPEEPEEDDDNPLPPGLYPAGTIMAWKNGEEVANRRLKSWDQLLEEELVYVHLGGVYSNFIRGPYVNNSSNGLVGDIVIPDGITGLGEDCSDEHEHAFSYCKNLTGIYIPSSVRVIEDDAFIQCTALRHVVFEEGSQLTYLGAEAFMYDAALESINLGDTQVRTFSVYRQFYGCSSLQSIEFPNTLTEITTDCFRSCTSLRSISIPASVTKIESYAFYGCTGIESLTIAPNSQLQTIGNLAFFDINVSEIWIPKTVTRIDHQAFCSIDNLQRLTFEEGGTEGLTIGNQGVFRSCISLTDVYLPKRLIKLDSGAFDSDTELRIIHFGGTRQEWENVNKVSSWKPPRLEQVICADGEANCAHTGGTATCTVRKVCTECGISYGTTLAHTGGTATCLQLKVCTVCNQEYGSLASHTGGTATCTKLKECTVCGQEYGSLASHKGGTATCTQKKICTECGVEYGYFASHTGGTATCTQLKVCTKCGAEYGSLASHTGGTATCIKLKECTVCGQEYGSLSTTHVGGTATCTQKKVCTLCNIEYGDFAPHEGGMATCQVLAQCAVCGNEYGNLASHQISGGMCQVCGNAVTVIESPHNYANNQNYVVLGTWDYSDAQSVDITIEYQTESTNYDWISLTAGNDYVAGTSSGDTRTYLSTSGSLVSVKGSVNNIKFGGTTRTTKTFNNVDMLQGTVVLRSDTSSTYWGAKITIIPNY